MKICLARPGIIQKQKLFEKLREIHILRDRYYIGREHANREGDPKLRKALIVHQERKNADKLRTQFCS